jgi:hypothetical protein
MNVNERDHCPGICLERQMKTAINLTTAGVPNRLPAEYKSEALPLEQNCSVRRYGAAKIVGFSLLTYKTKLVFHMSTL